VGEVICRANSTKKGFGWKIIEEIEPDTWTIQTHCERYAHAVVYQVGASIVAIEVKADFAQNVIEPLMESYGFENIKWLSTPEKDNI
jgi:tRNA U34 2-thiouridine synthase MnmA/TrmU